MSNYWMPRESPRRSRYREGSLNVPLFLVELYWIDTLGPTTKFAPLKAISRVYYFMPTNSDKSNVTAFPDGLRILAGNPNNKAYTGQYAFSCQRNREMTDVIQGNDFNFDMDCPFGMKSNMYYQNCWNGKDLWLPGNAHMSYTASGNPRVGACPWSHPVRVPSMMLEVTWQTMEYAPGQSLKGHLAWANGDTTGHGFHSDFTNGWDRDVFIAAMNSPACYGSNDDNMGMAECPVFAASQDRNKAMACRPTAGTLKEPTGVVENVAIDALPGCNPLCESLSTDLVFFHLIAHCPPTLIDRGCHWFQAYLQPGRSWSRHDRSDWHERTLGCQGGTTSLHQATDRARLAPTRMCPDQRSDEPDQLLRRWQVDTAAMYRVLPRVGIPLCWCWKPCRYRE